MKELIRRGPSPHCLGAGPTWSGGAKAGVRTAGLGRTGLREDGGRGPGQGRTRRGRQDQLGRSGREGASGAHVSRERGLRCSHWGRRWKGVWAAHGGARPPARHSRPRTRRGRVAPGHSCAVLDEKALCAWGQSCYFLRPRPP